MPVIAKTANGIDAAVRRAQKQANRTGKAVEVHYYRPKTEGTGRGRYKAYYTTVHPEKGNRLKMNRTYRASSVRVNRVNGGLKITIRQPKAKKRRR